MKRAAKKMTLIRNIFLLSHRFDRKITLYEIMHGICLNLSKIINVILPAYILNLIARAERWDGILLAILGYGVSYSLLQCGERTFKLLQEAHGFQACNLLRLSMNQKFMRIDYEDTENPEVVDTLEKAKDSMWEFCDVGYVLFDDILGNSITFLCMSYILTDIHILLYLAILSGICVSLYFQNKRNRLIHESELKEKLIKKQLHYTAGVMQDDKAAKEIRMFHLKDYLLRQYDKHGEKYTSQVGEREQKNLFYTCMQKIVYFFQLILVYMTAICRFIAGKLQIGSFLLYVSSITQLTESVNNLLEAFVELSKVSLYYQDYTNYMDIPERLHQSGEEPVPAAGETVIEFRDVSLRYPNSPKLALEKVSFVLKGTDKIGLIGENGSGKSTLVKLLLRLYDPTEGAIYFNRKDIRTYRYQEYLKQLKAVFQDFSVLPYSILENIVFDREVDKTRLEEILRFTGFDAAVKKYKAGIHSMVTKVLSDEGVLLSGGESQLMAICRAFYHDSFAVVFDEPTAALDPLKEREIFELIRRLSEEKMVIFCAHRMSSTVFCSKLLVLEEGKLIEMGTHEELMERKGSYYALYQKQAGMYGACRNGETA